LSIPGWRRQRQHRFPAAVRLRASSNCVLSPNHLFQSQRLRSRRRRSHCQITSSPPPPQNYIPLFLFRPATRPQCISFSSLAPFPRRSASRMCLSMDLDGTLLVYTVKFLLSEYYVFILPSDLLIFLTSTTSRPLPDE
jgi:hypothetical protein